MPFDPSTRSDVGRNHRARRRRIFRDVPKLEFGSRGRYLGDLLELSASSDVRRGSANAGPLLVYADLPWWSKPKWSRRPLVKRCEWVRVPPVTQFSTNAL